MLYHSIQESHAYVCDQINTIRSYDTKLLGIEVGKIQFEEFEKFSKEAGEYHFI